MNKELIYYLITDPKYYTNDPIEFEKKLVKTFNSKKVNIACFRDKTSKNFVELSKIFVETCKKFNIDRILINSDYKLAFELKAHGVHLTSKQFNKIKKAKELNLYTIISCHNEKDIQEAKKNKIDAITYSPIFETPNKGKAKGISKLVEIMEKNKDLNIIALGGIINDSQIKQLEKTNAYGFASIRYFI